MTEYGEEYGEYYYSSEEESSEEEEDEPWNPNELVERIQAVESAEEKKQLKRELLEKFFDQKRPLLTARVREFFNEKGMIETVISFITRLDERPALLPQGAIRDLGSAASEKEVKRSYNVMGILLKAINDLDPFIVNHLKYLLSELYHIFKANSFGNFHHFHKILEYLLINLPTETTKVLISEGLIWQMLDSLHEIPVVDSMIGIFCTNFPKQGDAIQFYKSLVESRVFEKIGTKIYGAGQVGSLPTSDFFIKLLEKLASLEMSGILFISLCRTSSFIDGLFKVINAGEESAYTEEQQKAAANVLRELLIKSGEKILDHTDITKPLPNMLSAVHDKLHDYAKPHIPKLAEVLVQIDNSKAPVSQIPFSAYIVKRPFGLYRFSLVEILCDVVSVCPDFCLNNLPVQLWRVLCNWFIEYGHNNLYHCQFFKLIQVIIHEDHVPTQECIFKKYKFLTRLIEYYKTEDSEDARGFIIMMLNMVRFAGDIQPSSGWLRRYLASHDAWRLFLTDLREVTIEQMKRYESEMIGDEIDLEFDQGIDIGSAYARSLGFDLEPSMVSPPTPEPTKKKKKKNKKKKEKEEEQEEREKCTTLFTLSSLICCFFFFEVF